MLKQTFVYFNTVFLKEEFQVLLKIDRVLNFLGLWFHFRSESFNDFGNVCIGILDALCGMFRFVRGDHVIDELVFGRQLEAIKEGHVGRLTAKSGLAG